MNAERSTIEEESIGTKTSLDSDCNTINERVSQLGIGTPPCLTRQSHSHLMTQLCKYLIKKLN